MEECDHTYGFFTICDEADLIYTKEELERISNDSSFTFVDIFNFCPDCGERL